MQTDKTGRSQFNVLILHGVVIALHRSAVQRTWPALTLSRQAAFGMLSAGLCHSSRHDVRIRSSSHLLRTRSSRTLHAAGATADMASTAAARLAHNIVPAQIQDLESIAHNNVVMAKVRFLVFNVENAQWGDLCDVCLTVSSAGKRGSRASSGRVNQRCKNPS